MDGLTVAEVKERIAQAEQALTAEISHELSLLAGEDIHPHSIDVKLVSTQAIGESRPRYHLAGVQIRVEILP